MFTPKIPWGRCPPILTNIFLQKGLVGSTTNKPVVVIVCPLHPRKLTWNPKMEVWKMIFLFKGMIFMFHFSFRGSMQIHENARSSWHSLKPSALNSRVEGTTGSETTMQGMRDLLRLRVSHIKHFCIFTPKIGEMIPNLTNVFFWWVGSTKPPANQFFLAASLGKIWLQFGLAQMIKWEERKPPPNDVLKASS